MGGIKDRVAVWYIQNVIIPKIEIIDKPGFIVTTFTEQGRTTYLREFLLPEGLLERIEDKFTEKFGRKGEELLYSSGKKFGYSYVSLSNFPRKDEMGEAEFKRFAYNFVMYIAAVFAKWAKYQINLKEETFSIRFRDYIVCRHNGKGFILTEGGVAGIWAYEMKRKDIEATQVQCQGRGDKLCMVDCAPADALSEKYGEIKMERSLPEIRYSDEYRLMNSIRMPIYAKNSMKTLIDSGYFLYKKGSIMHERERFFPCESHLVYILEEEAKKLKGGREVLFNACFEWGKEFATINAERISKNFISDIFSSLGFGDISVAEKSGRVEVTSFHYPWTVFSEKSGYDVFRGVLSGIFSYITGKYTELELVDVEVGDSLIIRLEGQK
ncbi:MAG: hypothetical protein DRN25_06005 [Thermoplasmata archaeon]|nr:MAG: hypothetical protein DRN25_06005 [Thermoplasmata archaeon]